MGKICKYKKYQTQTGPIPTPSIPKLLCIKTNRNTSDGINLINISTKKQFEIPLKRSRNYSHVAKKIRLARSSIRYNQKRLNRIIAKGPDKMIKSKTMSFQKMFSIWLRKRSGNVCRQFWPFAKTIYFMENMTISVPHEPDWCLKRRESSGYLFWSRATSKVTFRCDVEVLEYVKDPNEQNVVYPTDHLATEKLTNAILVCATCVAAIAVTVFLPWLLIN